MAQIKTEPLTDTYDVKEELGRGRFAVVKRCVKISTGEVFAAKCIRKARAGRRGREQLLLEIDILHTSDHPKLVKLYDVFETRSEMILILEYAAGGDLHKHCLEVETIRTEKEICSLIYQIVEAASYLHDHHVVHLDLKPENILLKNDQRFPEIRLIDFGLSRRVDLPYSQYDIVGTPEYVAPEILSYETIQISADMWSIGVVAYVLLSGISPFAGDDVMETYSNIANVDFDFDAEEFDDISDEAKDFIESLLIKEPKERLTTKQCMEHDWLKQMSSGINQADIEEALIAEETFEKLIREGSISIMESEGDSVFSSDGEDDAVDDREQRRSSEDSSDILYEEEECAKEDCISLESVGDVEPSVGSLEIEAVKADTEEVGTEQSAPSKQEVHQQEEVAVFKAGEEEAAQNALGVQLVHQKEEVTVIESDEVEAVRDVPEVQEVHQKEEKEFIEPKGDTNIAVWTDQKEPLKCNEKQGKMENSGQIGIEAILKDSFDKPNDKQERIVVEPSSILKEESQKEGSLDLPDLSKPLSGGFDIDSLLSKDDEAVGSEVNGEEKRLYSEQEDNEAPVTEPKSANLVLGIVANDATVVAAVPDTAINETVAIEPCDDKVSPVVKVESPVITPVAKSSRRFVYDNWEKVSQNETASPSVQYKKQRSSEAVLGPRKSINILTPKSESREPENRPSLKKVRSVDDALIGGGKKSSDSVRGKLGAHFEKLCKAGLNLNGEQEVVRPGPIKIKQGSHRRNDSGEKLILDTSIAGSKEVKSARSSGSSTPSSGRGTPDLPRKSSSNLQPSVSPVVKDTSTALSKKQDLKGSAVGMRGKTATPSDDKSACPKKNTPNLGVRQGIAAQMASIFAGGEKPSTPPAARANKTPVGQSVVSNRKVFEGKADSKIADAKKEGTNKLAAKEVERKISDTKKPESKRVGSKMTEKAEVKGTENQRSKDPIKSSSKTDLSSVFSTALKVAKGEAPPQQSPEFSRKSRSPRSSPKMDRSSSSSESKSKVKKSENIITVGPESNNKWKAQVQYQKKSDSNVKSSGNQVKETRSDTNAKKTVERKKSKENVVGKYEKQTKGDKNDKSKENQVHVQPKGLQINFNLQAGNKFRQMDVDKNASDINSNKREITAPVDGKKLVTFNINSDSGERNKFEPVSVPKSFSGMLDDQEDEHLEHTAIGAIATMPRKSLRELRGRSRTSRDRGDGSPSSPRKAYRRLYVTHVKGSKSEQEAETSDDIAEFKTKVEEDELKVELLVKFPDFKYGTL